MYLINKMRLFVLFLLVAASFVGCKKEDPTYPFTIQVVREDGSAMPNVLVTATADVPDAIPNFSGITGDDGTVSFEYQYEAVLKITAIRGNNPPTWMGCNFVKLEADKNVTTVVVLLPFDPTQPGC